MAFELFEAHQRRKEHEQTLESTIGQLRKANRALQTLSECNQILVRSTTERALIQEICNAIFNTAGYKLCWFGYIEGPEKERRIVPAAYAGIGKKYIERLHITLDDGADTSKGPTARAVRTSEASAVNSIQDSLDYAPWKDAAIEQGYQSSIALPLLEDDRVFAVLNIYAAEAEVFRGEEKHLLTELAEDLSYGIRNIRSKKLKERNEKLLDSIIENLPLGLQIFDDQGYSFRINKKQQALLGIPSKEEGVGTFNVLTDPYSIAHGADKLYREVYKGNAFFDMENEYNFDIQVNTWETRREKRFFNESIFPIFTRDDQVGYVVSLLSDVTDQHLKERQISANEKKYRGLFNSIRDAILVTDTERTIIDCNPAFSDLFGYPLEDLKGKKTAAVYNSEAEFARMGKVLKEHKSKVSEFLFTVTYKKRDGTSFPGETNVFYLRDDNDQVIGFIGLIRDISSRKEAEEKLQSSKKKYKRLVDNSPNMIMETDVDTHEIISCNPAMAKNLGHPVTSIVGRKIENFIPSDILQKRIEMGEKAIETGEAQVLEDKQNGKWFYTIYIPVTSEGGRSVQTITMDITERKRSEVLLKEYADRLELTMEAAKMAWWEMDIDSGHVRFNKKKAEMLGYPEDRFHHYEDFTKLLHPDDHEPAMTAMHALLQGRKETYDIEYRIKTASGGYRWFHDIGTITHRSDEDKPLMVSGIVLDVTEKNRIKHELMKMEEIIERSDIATFIWKNDAGWPVEFVSDNVDKIFGHTRTDFLSGTVCYADCIHPDDLKRVINEVQDASNNDKTAEFVHEPYRIITKDGRTKIITNWSYLQYDDSGNVVAYKGIIHDITAEKLIKDKLKQMVEEKEFLMKELNHRVKNNLTMVSSLISLKDMESSEDLSDLKNRIDVIKLVHEKLHHQNDIENITARDYFQELLTAVFSSTSHLDVEVINTVEELGIPTRIAIPLGLVVNEIATNAIKHGFTSEGVSRFTIDMRCDKGGEQYLFKLSNSGKPFPEQVGLDNPETMGLQLVSSLISQVGGSLELQKKPETTFIIRFPKNRE
jgi:PAS domain S-box-containing protein